MKIFDSHSHLNDPAFAGDFPQVKDRMAEAEVKRVMVVGISGRNSESAVKLAQAHEGFYASVGVHPHDAARCDRETLNRLRDLTEDENVRAWGETGLDFNRMYSSREDQEKWFSAQLEMADQCGLPLILHERDSEGRFLEMLRQRYPDGGGRGVVHCFSGNQTEMEAYLSLGFHIGITGILTVRKRGENLRRLVLQIPDDRILIETDAPYLTPTPQRNRFRRNEPAFVRTVLMKLAEIRQEAPETLAAKLWGNTNRLFGLDD